MTTASLRHTMNHIDLLGLFRSKHRSCSVKKCVPKNFANYPGKHLCWSLFLIALQVEISSAKDCFYLFHLKILQQIVVVSLDETLAECKVSIFLKRTEAVARRCSVKKVFLENSQNSQEHTCARASFLIKFQ